MLIAAFQSVHTTLPQQRTAAPPPTLKSFPPANRFPTRFAHTAPTLGNPVPMDVYAARRAMNKVANKCFCCGRAGHFVKDCLQPMDVRSMNQEELDVWMEQISTRMDEINLLASSEEEKSEIAEQDFPTGGR